MLKIIYQYLIIKPTLYMAPIFLIGFIVGFIAGVFSRLLQELGLTYHYSLGISLVVVGIAVSALYVAGFYSKSLPNWLKRDFVLEYTFFVGLITLGFALIYYDLGVIDTTGQTSKENSTVFEYFFSCLYLSIVTITTLGYGDVQPTVGARPWAALEGVVGYVLLGVFVAKLISLAKR